MKRRTWAQKKGHHSIRRQMARRPYPRRRTSTPSPAWQKTSEEQKKPGSLVGLWVATIMFAMLILVLMSTPGGMNGFTIGFILFVGLALLGTWLTRKERKAKPQTAQQEAIQVLEKLRKEKGSDQKRQQHSWDEDFLRLKYPGMTEREAKMAAYIDASREHANKIVEEDRKRYLSRRAAEARDTAENSSPKNV